MRAFISINIPEEIKKEIAKLQKSLPEFGGKKTEAENLHLTLKFLGDVDDKNIEEIRNQLRNIKIKKFEVETGEIGIFSPSFIKIIWLSLNNCEKLQKEIDSALKNLFEPEKRFMGHLTIARVKKVRDKKRFLDKISQIKINKKRFVVGKFYLMKSELTEKGPVYSVVEEFGQ
jgi:2'-5' RNA ligase